MSLQQATIADLDSFTAVTGASADTARTFINGAFRKYLTVQSAINYFFENPKAYDSIEFDTTSSDDEEFDDVASPLARVASPGASSAAPSSGSARGIPPPPLRSQLSEAGLSLLRRGLSGVALHELESESAKVLRIRERFDVLRFVHRATCWIVRYDAATPLRRRFVVTVRRHKEWSEGVCSLLIDAVDATDGAGGATTLSIALHHAEVAALREEIGGDDEDDDAATRVVSTGTLARLLATGNAIAASDACSANMRAALAVARAVHLHIVIDAAGELAVAVGGGAADVAAIAAIRSGWTPSADGKGPGLVGGRPPTFSIGEFIDDIPWDKGVGWEGVIFAVRHNPNFRESEHGVALSYVSYPCRCDGYPLFDSFHLAWDDETDLSRPSVRVRAKVSRFLYDCRHDDGATTYDVPEEYLTPLAATDVRTREAKVASIAAKVARGEYVAPGSSYTEANVRSAIRRRGYLAIVSVKDRSEEVILEAALAESDGGSGGAAGGGGGDGAAAAASAASNRTADAWLEESLQELEDDDEYYLEIC